MIVDLYFNFVDSLKSQFKDVRTQLKAYQVQNPQQGLQAL